MSVRAITAAFDSDYGVQYPARRLVLIALADSAGDDGITWVSQAALAEKACVSEPTVRAAIQDLEEQGMLQTAKATKGRTRRNVYRLVFAGMKDPDYDRLPFDLEQQFPTTESQLRSSTFDDRKPAAPTTVTELRSRARGSSLDLEPSKDPSGPPVAPPRPMREIPTPNRPVTVDRRRVSDEEFDQAWAILEVFNHNAGTAYWSKDWVAKIVMRLREHPELEVEAHAIVIARVLEEPWWRGDPSPSVIYGNAAIFERSVHAVRTTPPERPMTPEEMEAHGG